MRRRVWLAHPTEPVAPLIEVRNNPVRINAAGLQIGDEVQVEVLVGPGPSGVQGVDYQWVPLYRNGEPIVLDSENRTYVEFLPGYYRVKVDPAIAGRVLIEAVEDEAATEGKGKILIEVGHAHCRREEVV